MAIPRSDVSVTMLLGRTTMWYLRLLEGRFVLDDGSLGNDQRSFGWSRAVEPDHDRLVHSLWSFALELAVELGSTCPLFCQEAKASPSIAQLVHDPLFPLLGNVGPADML